MPARSTLLIHLSLLIVAVAWGSTFVSIKYLLRTLDPADVLILRLTLGSLFFLLVVMVGYGGLEIPRREDWGRIGLVALLGITLNTSAIVFGTRLIPAALASLIITSNPIFTAIISRVIGGEPLTRRKVGGIAIAFVGFLIVLLYGGQEAEFSIRNTAGVLVTLCAPLVWAFYTVLSKPLLTRYEPTRFAAIITMLGTIPLLPLLLVDASIVRDVWSFNRNQWIATIAMTAFALVTAFILWYRGLKVLSPTQIAVYLYLVPVFGALGAWLLLGERITIYLLLGGATILAGVILTNTSRRGPIDQMKRPRQPAPVGHRAPASPASSAGTIAATRMEKNDDE